MPDLKLIWSLMPVFLSYDTRTVQRVSGRPASKGRLLRTWSPGNPTMFAVSALSAGIAVGGHGTESRTAFGHRTHLRRLRPDHVSALSDARTRQNAVEQVLGRAFDKRATWKSDVVNSQHDRSPVTTRQEKRAHADHLFAVSYGSF